MADDPRSIKADAKAEKAREKAMRPWFKKKRFILPLALMVIAIIAVAAAPKEDTEKIGTTDDVDRSEETVPEVAEEEETPTTKKQAENKTFAVGDNVKRGHLEVAVLQVNPNVRSANEFIKPDPGKKFVGVELQIKNNDDESESFSTLLQMKLKDASNAQYDISFGAAPDPTFPEGELAAGDTARGWVGFEVPTGATGFRFIFDAAVFGGGQIIWNLGI